MRPMPVHHCLTRPQPHRFANYTVSHPIYHRISRSGRTRLERRTRHIPLQQPHLSPLRRGQMRQLMDHQTFTRPRQPRHPNDPLA